MKITESGLIFLLAFVCISQGLDFEPPFSLNVSQKAKPLEFAGFIRTKGSSSQSPKYFILQASTNNSITNDNSIGNSLDQLTLNNSINDCDEAVVKRYQAPRSYFCINHDTGEVFTTKEFPKANATVGDQFYLQIKVENKSQWFTVNIIEFCVKNDELYDVAIQCSKLLKPEAVDCVPLAGDVWICPNITTPKPYYPVAFWTNTENSRRRTFDALVFNEAFKLASGQKRTREYSFLHTFDKTFNLTSIEKNIEVRQLLVQDRFETCQKFDECSTSIGQVTFSNQVSNGGCFDFKDPYFLKLRNKWCQEKQAPLLLNKVYNAATPIKQSTKVIDTSYAPNNTTPMKFEIVTVTGPQLYTAATPIFPKECTSNINTLNKTTPFCIDANNGNIYLTTDITNIYSSNVTFEIDVRAISMSPPMKASVRKLRLVVTNPCYSTLNFELEQTGCQVDPLIVSASNSINFTHVEFTKIASFASIFAAKINSPSNIGNASLLISSGNDSVKLPISLTSLIPLDISRFTGKSLLISIEENLNNGSRQFQSMRNHTVELIYSNRWSQCERAFCLKNFGEWKKKSTDKSSCSSVGSYVFFEQCAALQPSFFRGPHLPSESNILKGCRYKSRVDLSNFTYWVINGTSRVNVSIQTAKETSNDEYGFPVLPVSLTFQPTTYQCEIFDPLRMSNPVKSAQVTFVKEEFVPKFVTGPIINGTVLRGCEYKANTSFVNYTSWLINDNVIVNKVGLVLKPNENLFSFPLFLYTDFLSHWNNTQNTSYRCRIYDPNKMRKPLLSDKVFMTFRLEQPTFVIGPILTNTQITGCAYASNPVLSTDHSYWLINSNQQLNNTWLTSSTSNTLRYFSPLMLQSNDTLLKTGDSVQCVSQLTGTQKQIFSEKLLLNFSKPYFTKSPRVLGRSAVAVGDTIDIQGCEFVAKFPHLITKTYWYQDEKVKTFTRFSNISTSHYAVSSLTYTTSTQMNQGYYQCVLELNDGQKITSNETVMRFKDASETMLSMRLVETWDNLYNSASSAKYKKLETYLRNQVGRSMKSLLPTLGQGHLEVLKFRPLSGNVMADIRLIYTDVDQRDQTRICDELRRAVNNELLLSSVVKQAEIVRQDCCFTETRGNASDRGLYKFNTTLANQDVTLKCVYDGSTVVKRKCVRNLKSSPRWSEFYSDACQEKFTSSLKSIDEVNICSDDKPSVNCSSVIDVSANLSSTVKRKKQLTSSEDVNLITKIITKISINIDQVNTTTEAEQVLDNVLTSVNIIIASPKEIVQQKKSAEPAATTEIVNDLNEIASRAGKLLANDSKTSVSVSKENIAVNVARVNKADTYILPREQNGVLSLEIKNSPSYSNETGMTIPKTAFPQNVTIIQSFVYRGDVLFSKNDNNNRTAELERTKKFYAHHIHGYTVVDGKVLSASIGHSKISNLSDPIKFKFKKTLKRRGSRSCQFWDFNKDDWSDFGCSVVKEDQAFVYCECNHLTNFALILDVSQTGYNPLSLKFITWVGGGISLAGLLLTILSYISLRKLRSKLAPKLLICLCVSLLSLLLAFLFGAERTEPRIACQMVAMLLQFFTLSTFSWMAIEAFNLYRCFVRIFKSNSSSDTKFMIKSSIAAWGVPLVITTATAAVDPSQLGDDKLCVVRGYQFYFGLLLPVSMILLGNFVVLYFVTTGIQHVRRSASKSKREKQEKMARSRITFTCSLLLGLSWIFAVLALGKLTLVFQWLFCIFTSLQGFFIFIFYTVKNKEVWEEWRKKLGIKPSSHKSVSVLKKFSWSALYLSRTSSSDSTMQRSTKSTKCKNDVFSENKC